MLKGGKAESLRGETTHIIFSQRPRFIAAQHIHSPQVLHCTQVAHQAALVPKLTRPSHKVGSEYHGHHLGGQTNGYRQAEGEGALPRT